MTVKGFKVSVIQVNLEVKEEKGMTEDEMAGWHH